MPPILDSETHQPSLAFFDQMPSDDADGLCIFQAQHVFSEHNVS